MLSYIYRHCICGAILAALEWNHLSPGVWSFWGVVEFGLPVFCWEFLPLCSLNILVYNSIILFFCHIFVEFCNKYRSLILFLPSLFPGSLRSIIGISSF
jgi:hypothetical protein